MPVLSFSCGKNGWDQDFLQEQWGPAESIIWCDVHRRAGLLCKWQSKHSAALTLALTHRLLGCFKPGLLADRPVRPTHGCHAHSQMTWHSKEASWIFKDRVWEFKKPSWVELLSVCGKECLVWEHRRLFADDDVVVGFVRLSPDQKSKWAVYCLRSEILRAKRQFLSLQSVVTLLR